MDEPVPLRDAEIAAGIASAARGGRPADRKPTLEQVLAAFGETEPTSDARARAERALAIAGVTVAPPLADAEPGQRVLLTATAPGGGKSRGRRALLGLGALALLIGGAALAAGLAGELEFETAGDALPDSTPPPAMSAPPPAAATVPPTTETATTATATVPTTTTETAARPRKRAAKRRRRAVTVRVSAVRPTFLCVEDLAGRRLFHGTLTGRRTFRSRRIRMNIGLDSTEVRVNGRRVPLSGSPTGLELSRERGARFLALGRRPC